MFVVKIDKNFPNPYGWERKQGRHHDWLVVPNKDALPEAPQLGELWVEAWEKGGGYTKTSAPTQVICGVEGEPLTPLYVRKSGHLACSEHALFRARQLVTVEARKEEPQRVLIRLISGDEPYEKVLFEGFWGDNPPELDRFESAVNSAFKKSACFHCRHIHYACSGDIYYTGDNWIITSEW